MGETMISLNIRFSPELDVVVQKLQSEGRRHVSKASIIKELMDVFGRTLPKAEGFMKPLREIDRNVSISFEGLVDGKVV
jgi:hypothetical protein